MHDILRADLDAILVRKPGLWDGLRGCSLFLTGGTGWFGRWLLEAIRHANARLNAGIRVTVLSRNPAAIVKSAQHLVGDQAIRFHVGDVRDFAFPDGCFSHILHAATTSARETYEGAAPLAKFDTLVAGTRRVLDFAASCGCEQFLFTSSGVAYGPAPGERGLREDDHTAPDTMDPHSGLGQAKRAAEFLCAEAAARQGWNLTVARCFAFVGPYMPMDIHYAIGNFIGQAVRGEPVVVKGDGLPLRSYLYTADLVVWLLTLLQRRGPTRLYNVGSDERVSIRELAEMARDVLNPGGEVKVLGERPYSIGNPVRDCYVPDISRARLELDLIAWTSLNQALMRTGNDYKMSLGRIPVGQERSRL